MAIVRKDTTVGGKRVKVRCQCTDEWTADGQLCFGSGKYSYKCPVCGYYYWYNSREVSRDK